MAQFTEITKIISRMPEEMAADFCARIIKDAEGVERAAQAWAKEHPEPHFPTWAEWLCEMGVSRISSYEDNKIIYSRTRKYYEEMDADTAKRLGIEPIGKKQY